MTVYDHIPVLRNEILEAFDLGRPSVVVDGTLGLGGHSEALLARYPDMRILGLDWDQNALEDARRRLEKYADRFEAVEANYAELSSILSQRGRGTVDGLLLDLGLSSRQLLDTDRGFSFLRPGPLDMRMSRSLTVTAWQLLNTSSEFELADLLRRYGEEPQSRKIARALKDALRNQGLPNDAWKVAELIRRVAPSPMKRIDPATRCFQALRIVVNHELENLESALDQLQGILNPGGRAAIISFHSLEDRPVKLAFHAAAKGCLCPPRIPQCMCGQVPWARRVNRKVIIAQDDESRENPRSRSAKLRIMEKIPTRRFT